MVRLLIVDDHILFVEALTSLFMQQPDFEVVGHAGSVSEAVAQSLIHQPDVVLMDFYLPDGTGLMATEIILAERPGTKIVFLTAHEEDERLFAAIRYGAKGYLIKTTPSNALLAALRGLERGEAAINRAATSRIMEEFSHLSAFQESAQDATSKLTNREHQILEELRKGATNRQIAERLVISEQTVKNHISKILSKLKLKSRHEAIHWANRYNR